MKIVHVVDCMNVGGVETIVSQLCRLQRNEGHDPHIYAIGKLGKLGKQLQADGFMVHPRTAKRIFDALPTFYKIFKTLHPDIVHLHNPAPTIFAAFAARLAGVPRIVSTRHNLVAKPRRVLRELMYALSTRHCDWIACVCDATADNLREIRGMPRRKIVRVYNGVVPLPRIPPHLCPPKCGFTLLYGARLAPVKNHSLLFSALRLALQSISTLQLWIVGDGSERHRLEKLATELGIATQVTFWGLQMDVAPFFSAADATIFSSISEGLPLSLLQGFSLGMPAIVTDVGGMAEVVRRFGAGIPVSATDPGEMAEAILRLSTEPEELRQLGSNAREAFQAHFTLQHMANSYTSLYLDSDQRGL